ncbi:hypothetical protein FACS189461_1090 [Spirochaetia bacterium]|nr:hypothetical protein FACS189461_1090 [Spirochaetia bacterium]
MDRMLYLREWLDLAENDIRVAEHSTELYPIPVEIVCYHCEQAAEKYLKAFLLLNSFDPPRIHDLSALCKQCETYDGDFRIIAGFCSDLTKYGTQPRYPFEIEIEKADMDRALYEAHQAAGFIAGKIDALLILEQEQGKT